MGADITVLEPGRFPVDPAESLSAVNWGSFEGREFFVRVAATYVRGQLAWDGSHIQNEAGTGQFLKGAGVG
jgi:allantoinase